MAREDGEWKLEGSNNLAGISDDDHATVTIQDELFFLKVNELHFN